VGAAKGRKNLGLDLLLRERLEAMWMFMLDYCSRETDDTGTHHGKWSAASLATAKAFDHGPWHARKLCQWAHTFIVDRTDIPMNQYGTWCSSSLDDDNVVEEIHQHIRLIGKYMKAMDIIHFLGTPEMLDRLHMEKPISLKTAQHWLKRHDYRYTKEPSGQFVDGHERVDVRSY
jgi:hypothetical protein